MSGFNQFTNLKIIRIDSDFYEGTLVSYFKSIGLGVGANSKKDPSQAISLGKNAGKTNPAFDSVSIGSGSGEINQKGRNVCIGFNSGQINQGV